MSDNDNIQESNITKYDNMPVSELKAYAMHLDDISEAIIHSTSWKITAPLRFFLDMLKRKSQKKLVKKFFGIQRKKILIKRFFIYLKRGLKRDRMFEKEIDIIIPVHNGYDYLDSLFASIKKTSVPYRLICVHDKSTDGRVAPYLDELSKNFGNMLLLSNEENLGFVKSVNKALALAKNHVVILNTDTEMPDEWLERLITPLYENPIIASATPFTNSGSTSSFPFFNQDNDLIFGMKLDLIDNAFKKIKPTYYEIPTGVGFCMAMSIYAIRKIGLLDEAFGKGYGEESDWSRRAVRAGYKNVMVENLFVWHKHGGSFHIDDRNELLSRNMEIFKQKHPEFFEDVMKFYEANPHHEQRLHIFLELLSKSDANVICYFDYSHDLGGGSSIYSKKAVESKSKDNILFLIHYDDSKDEYVVSIRMKDSSMSFTISNISDLAKFISSQKISEIIVNSLITYPDVLNTLKHIIELKSTSGAKLTNIVHDYFSICPAYVLLDYKGNFCGDSGYPDCDVCFKQNDNYDLKTDTDVSIYEWRSKWKAFLTECNTIKVFSNSSKKILNTAFGTLNQIEITPHIVDYIKKVDKKNKPLNIAYLGTINNKAKGFKIIKEMVAIVDRENYNIRTILFGQTLIPIVGKCHSLTGRYNPEDLPKLALEHNIDIFFIPSICSETFSYTTQEAIEMNMPVACFDIGAQAERVKKYDKGIIIPEMTAQCAIDTVSKWYASLEIR